MQNTPNSRSQANGADSGGGGGGGGNGGVLSLEEEMFKVKEGGLGYWDAIPGGVSGVFWSVSSGCLNDGVHLTRFAVAVLIDA